MEFAIQRSLVSLEEEKTASKSTSPVTIAPDGKPRYLREMSGKNNNCFFNALLIDKIGKYADPRLYACTHLLSAKAKPEIRDIAAPGIALMLLDECTRRKEVLEYKKVREETISLISKERSRLNLTDEISGLDLLEKPKYGASTDYKSSFKDLIVLEVITCIDLIEFAKQEWLFEYVVEYIRDNNVMIEVTTKLGTNHTGIDDAVAYVTKTNFKVFSELDNGHLFLAHECKYHDDEDTLEFIHNVNHYDRLEKNKPVKS